MAQSLLQLLKDYKRGPLTARPVDLGDETHADSISKQKLNDEIFISRLRSTRSSRFNLVVVIITVLLLIIVFLGVLIWKHNDNQAYVLALLGGESAGVFLAVNILLRLKREELFSSIIIDMVPKASTKEDKDKLIDTMMEYLKGK